MRLGPASVAIGGCWERRLAGKSRPGGGRGQSALSRSCAPVSGRCWMPPPPPRPSSRSVRMSLILRQPRCAATTGRLSARGVGPRSASVGMTAPPRPLAALHRRWARRCWLRPGPAPVRRFGHVGRHPGGFARSRERCGQRCLQLHFHATPACWASACWSHRRATWCWSRPLECSHAGPTRLRWPSRLVRSGPEGPSGLIWMGWEPLLSPGPAAWHADAAAQ